MPALSIGPFYIVRSDLVLTLLAALIAISIGWIYGKQLVKQGLDIDTAFQKGVRPWFILFGFLLLCGLIASVYKFSNLFSPYWLAYLETASWIMVKSGVLFLAGAAIPLGAVVGRHKDAVILFTLALIASVGIQAVQSTFLKPVSQSKITKRLASDGSILQSTDSTCTAAALANGLRLFHIEASEAEVARILGTRQSGTTQYQLLNGIKKYGLYGHFVPVKARYLARMKRPAVVSVLLHQEILHSILAYDSDSKGNLLVIDPLTGKGKYTPQMYEKKLERAKGIVLTNHPLPQLNAQSPRYQIEQVQQPLKQEHYLAEVSGNWDTETITAVKHFQKNYDLPITGEVDALSWLMITGPSQSL